MLFPARPSTILWLVSLSYTPFWFSQSYKCLICLLAFHSLVISCCLLCVLGGGHLSIVIGFFKCLMILGCLLIFNKEAKRSWLGVVCAWGIVDSVSTGNHTKLFHWANFCPCFHFPGSRIRNYHTGEGRQERSGF